MAYEGQSGESFEGSSAFPGVGKLCLQWRSARRHDDLPFYEDVALGSLGAMADDIALVQPSSDRTFVFLRAGAGVAKQFGRPLDTLAVTELDANYRDALTRGLGRALAGHEPTLTLARSVSDGMVATCEILALPLRNRWGGELILT